MKLAHFRHRTDDHRAPGIQLGHGSHLGNGPGYDMVAAVFFGGRRRQVFTRLAALSGAGPTDRVLDLGCGTGYFTRVMAEAVASGGSTLGVDPSPEVVTHARRLTHITNCTFAEGTAAAIDAPDGSFDVVVSSLMIHHLPEPLRPQAVREAWRVLRPGGRVLIADFRPPSSRMGRRMIGTVTSPAMENNRVRLLEPMVREAGFEHVLCGDVRPWIAYVKAVKPSA